jgi:cell division protein FtsW
MADIPIQPDLPSDIPQFIDEESIPRPVIATPHSTSRVESMSVENVKKKSFIATLDLPLILVVGVLVGVGSMMVYSTTFFWSDTEWGSDTYMLGLHLRNIAIGGALLIILAFIDYRIWRRFTVWMLLLTIGFLIGVLIFGDLRFGGRRALIAGSYQPGELAELVVVIYMAAWMGSKSAKMGSFFYGLLPFSMLVGIVGGLVIAQPDLSTAAIIFISSGLMFFLAGADLKQLIFVAVITVIIGLLVAQNLPYAQERIDDFQAGLIDLREADYHIQQAVIAFLEGGWFGKGLGLGEQKFGALPAPHTDSIFAVIVEELGILGAAFVVALYAAFVVRGFRVARNAHDAFGSLLAAGITVWVVTQALLNIAVMTGTIPPSGVPLPFISYGGSSMTVLLAGVGLLLSVNRVSVRGRAAAPERRVDASYDRGRGNGRARVPRASRG